MGQCCSRETVPACYYCHHFIKHKKSLFCQVCDMHFHLSCMSERNHSMRVCPACYNNSLKFVKHQIKSIPEEDVRSSFIKTNDDIEK